eukprot:scaffold89654_cov20-Tisochrysis_lutea.AAC.1
MSCANSFVANKQASWICFLQIGTGARHCRMASRRQLPSTRILDWVRSQVRKEKIKATIAGGKRKEKKTRGKGKERIG